MFRIEKIFENDTTRIFKFEGEIAADTADDFGAELEAIISSSSTTAIIFDFCCLRHISQKAIKILMGYLTGNVYIMNCPTFVKNILMASQDTENILEVPAIV